MTLPEFLKSYSKDEVLKAEYGACNKKELLAKFLKTKEVKEIGVMRALNISISKVVTAKLEGIMTGIHSCSYHFLDTFLTPF